MNNLYNNLIDRIENDEFHLYFDGDKNIFLQSLESLWLNKKLTDTEYSDLVDYVEDKTCGIPDCIWESMKLCDPDLCD